MLALPPLEVPAVVVTGIPDAQGPVAVELEEPVVLVEAIDAVAAPAGQVDREHRPSKSLLHQVLV